MLNILDHRFKCSTLGDNARAIVPTYTSTINMNSPWFLPSLVTFKVCPLTGSSGLACPQNTHCLLPLRTMGEAVSQWPCPSLPTLHLAPSSALQILERSSPTLLTPPHPPYSIKHAVFSFWPLCQLHKVHDHIPPPHPRSPAGHSAWDPVDVQHVSIKWMTEWMELVCKRCFLLRRTLASQPVKVKASSGFQTPASCFHQQ